MKNIYVVVCKQINGKYWAVADKIHVNVNLVAEIARRGAECVHLCENRQSAKELADYWNKCYINNCTSIFLN